MPSPSAARARLPPADTRARRIISASSRATASGSVPASQSILCNGPLVFKKSRSAAVTTGRRTKTAARSIAFGIPLLEAYASAKAAIVGFTNTLARALGPHRIRVNAIAPGTVLTERQRQLWFRTEAQVEAARAAQCLPDLIAPEDIANLALFLASDDSRLITKQTISVNAGVL